MPPKKRLRVADSMQRKNEQLASVSQNPVGRNVLALRTFYRGLVKQKSNSNKKNIVSYSLSQIVSEYPMEYPIQRVLKLIHRSKCKNGNYVHHDTIGKHILALRRFYNDLVTQKSSQKKTNVSNFIAQTDTPENPVFYPTHRFLRRKCKNKHTNKSQLNFKSHISKEKMEQIKTDAIKNILMQVGYDFDKSMKNSPALNLLSHVTDLFLQSFLDRMRFHKDTGFYDNQDLYTPLEAALHDFKYGGINGLRNFFNGEFCRLDESLYKDCIEQMHTFAKKSKKKKMPPLQKENKSSISAEMKAKDNSNATVVKANDSNAMMVQSSDCNATVVEDNDCTMDVDKNEMLVEV